MAVKPKALYLDQWSRLHGDIDPTKSVLLRNWLDFMYLAARPLARRRVPPDLVTYLGLMIAVGAAVLATRSGALWLIGAAVLIACNGLLDGLDGAVAIISGKTSRWGFVLDSVVDRVSDLMVLSAFWVVGADGLLVAVAVSLMMLLEYGRARAAAAGVTKGVAVTVGERPTRLVVAVAFLAAAAWSPDGHNAPWWAGVGVLISVGVGFVALFQLLISIRRVLH